METTIQADELDAAVVVARAVDPSWRHQLLDLLRAAMAVSSGLLDADGFAGNYAWVELRDAARSIRAGRDVATDDARLLYVVSLCESVLRHASVNRSLE